jgi:hypothetical protein
METNVIMTSSDRTLFGTTIRQQTKNSMLCISDLETVAKQRNIIAGYSVKHTSEVIARTDNKERIYYILKNQEVINIEMSTFIEHIKNKGITKYLKEIGAWKTTGARQTKTTWANPYVWMLLAMEFSPEIYGTAVTWLTDELILNRIEAGNMYKGLTNQISKFQNPNYKELAVALNLIVFNKHITGIRQSASQNQLKELELLERKIAFAIEMNYITSFSQTIQELKKIYSHKFKKIK